MQVFDFHHNRYEKVCEVCGAEGTLQREIDKVLCPSCSVKAQNSDEDSIFNAPSEAR